jgi:DNA-binding IclR family transcriptional regulator
MVLKSVASELKETCNIAAPGVGGMTYLDRVDTPWPLRFQLPVGTEVPFHCTASGKLFLSHFSDAELRPLLGSIDLTEEGPNCITDMERFLEEIVTIREAGYSWDNQEFMAGMVAVSVPIVDNTGRFDCALALHGPLQRISMDEARGYLPTLRNAAKRIADILFAHEDHA